MSAASSPIATIAAARGAPQGLSVSVVRDVAGLEALRADWRALERRVSPISPSKSHDWARAAWRATPADWSVELAVICVRRADELILVWPLSTHRHGGFSAPTHRVWPIDGAVFYRGVTMAIDLGCGANEEYGGPLVEDDADGVAATRLAIAAAKRLADVICVYHAPADSPVAREIAREGAIKHREVVLSPVTQTRGCADFAGWAARKSKSFRSGLRYDRKRLSGLGALASVQTTGGDAARDLVSWVFDVKKKWLAERGMAPNWINFGAGEAMFKALFAQQSPDGASDQTLRGFALKLDGAFVAACICMVSARRMEFFMTSFDDAYAAYSPGNLLIEDCVTFAIAADVDFDMRITQNAYKLRWLDRQDHFETIILASTARGAVFPLMKSAYFAKVRARDFIAAHVKTVLRKLGLRK